MRIDFYGLTLETPHVTFHLWSPWRAAEIEHRLFQWEGQIDELSPLATTLEAPGNEGRTVPVHLHSKVTEIGTLELSCLSRDGKQRWKLEFNVRERPE